MDDEKEVCGEALTFPVENRKSTPPAKSFPSSSPTQLFLQRGQSSARSAPIGYGTGPVLLIFSGIVYSSSSMGLTSTMPVRAKLVHFSCKHRKTGAARFALNKVPCAGSLSAWWAFLHS